MQSLLNKMKKSIRTVFKNNKKENLINAKYK